MKVLFIINDAPYGSEKAYNALRLAMMLQRDHKDAAVRLFLLGDAVSAALVGQRTPQGYYNVERMLAETIKGGAEVLLCRTCSTARGIADLGLHPDLLAINNGSKHGNYLPGEEVHIDLGRTLEIFNAIRPFGVCIAQHGITGTPPHLIGQFADNGIRKGNVATQWQNLCHELFPSELRRDIAKWVKDTGKDVKNASKHFKSEIAGIPEESRRAIEERAYREAREMLVHFRAPGTGTRVIERLAEGG